MSRKHFEMIARSLNTDIKWLLRHGAWEKAHAVYDTTAGLCNCFKTFNPLFDEDRFKNAVLQGVTPCDKANARFLTEVKGAVAT